MSNPIMFGIAVSAKTQKLMAETISATEGAEKKWPILAKHMHGEGYTSAMVRQKLSEDKASHAQLTELILAGLPANMQTAIKKPAKSRTVAQKELAATAQKRVGTYRIRLAGYLQALEPKPDDADVDKTDKTTAHKVAEYLMRAIRALESSEPLTGIPVGYKLSEHKEALKREYRAIAGKAYTSADGSK